MQTPEQAEGIGKQFAEHYYNTFKSDKSAVGRLYQEQSILTWEGKRYVGQQAIAQHLQSLPFGKIDFRLSTIDVQPTVTNGIVVFVTGQLVTEGETKPLQFSQLFHLMFANNTWVLVNDMFRLSLS